MTLCSEYRALEQLPLVSLCSQVGDINILINNAGVRRVRPFLSQTDVQIEKVINTNLYGTVRCEFHEAAINEPHTLS